jgi:4-hydroxybutyrate CoA-transferase
MALYLTEKHDLGIHTEQLPGGIVDLVDQGVVTGRYKEVHPGKVVASFGVQLSPEELARVDGHPAFELYDFLHTDDLRVILQFEHFVAVNNALFVDLTGNVCAETWGALPYTGPGGQPTFAYAASVISALDHRAALVTARGRRAPAAHVAMLPEGSTITAHRAFVDYVVTEQGIAKPGKYARERVRELISVAHPDLRGELRQAAARVYGVTA